MKKTMITILVLVLCLGFVEAQSSGKATQTMNSEQEKPFVETQTQQESFWSNLFGFSFSTYDYEEVNTNSIEDATANVQLRINDLTRRDFNNDGVVDTIETDFVCRGDVVYRYQFEDTEYVGWDKVFDKADCDRAGCYDFDERWTSGGLLVEEDNVVVERGEGDVGSTYFICHSEDTGDSGAWAWATSGWGFWDIPSIPAPNLAPTVSVTGFSDTVQNDFSFTVRAVNNNDNDIVVSYKDLTKYRSSGDTVSFNPRELGCSDVTVTTTDRYGLSDEITREVCVEKPEPEITVFEVVDNAKLVGDTFTVRVATFNTENKINVDTPSGVVNIEEGENTFTTPTTAGCYNYTASVKDRYGQSSEDKKVEVCVEEPTFIIPSDPTNNFISYLQSIWESIKSWF